MLFLIFCIAVDLDKLHAVEKRPRNRLDIVRSCNEKNLRKIDGHLHIMVGKMAVLLRIKHFQECGSDIPLVVAACLVDLIQKHQRIFHTGMVESLRDSSRHCSDVGSSMSADLRLISDSSKADPHKNLIQRLCNRLRDRCLSGSGRSDQTKDRSVRLFCHKTDRQIFQYPLLDFLETVMILLQNLSCLLQVTVVPGHFVPRKAEQRLDVSPDHSSLRRIAGCILKAADFIAESVLHLLRCL